MRAAIYYAPETDDLLWQSGCSWLGYDAYTGATVTQPAIDHLSAHTRAPRRYGFHATLKPPMHLTGSLANFERDVMHLAQQLEPVQLPQLNVTTLQQFITLTPTAPTHALQVLADTCVTQLDVHRLPEHPTIKARRAVGLSAKQLHYLEQWGYPFVMDCWQFHLTLSDNGAADPALLAAATAHFNASLIVPRRITSLALFIEDTPGAPFRLHKRFNLGH